MRNKTHLPMYGVGPLYGGVILLMTAIGIWLSICGKLPIARSGFLSIPLALLGGAMIVYGASLWVRAVVKAQIDKGIETNTLVTDGIYARVRNPIYSAFTLVCIGALLIYGNLYLLPLPFVFWIFLTLLMKHTEEKWLLKLYGKEYEEYCRKVNRCIPWRRRG